MKVKLLVANGVNLDLLGKRETNIYGSFDLQSLEDFLSKECGILVRSVFEKQISNYEIEFFQSNEESKFLEKLSSSDWDGALINPGAWTHTSLALGDRLSSIKKPFVEVHISNIARREDFRKISYSAPSACGVVYGFGMDSYSVALLGLLKAICRISA